jgi:hypothetical protein
LFRYPAALISTQRLRGSENGNDNGKHLFFVTAPEKAEKQRTTKPLAVLCFSAASVAVFSP